MSQNGSDILVVEDDAANRQGLVRLLQHDGRSVECAATVAAALAKLKAQPRIVLLDINLPDGSGVEVLHHIRSNAIQAKVCILTGSADPMTLEGLRHMQPDAIFLKPYHPAAVLQWVSEAHGK